MDEMKQNITNLKKDYYTTKENVIALAKEVDFLAREQQIQKKEHDLFKKEIKDEIKEEIQKSQKTTVLEIKEIIATEFKDNAKWKDRTLIGFIISMIIIVITFFVNNT